MRRCSRTIDCSIGRAHTTSFRSAPVPLATSRTVPPSGTTSSAHGHVRYSASVEHCKPGGNPDDCGDRPKYRSDELTQCVFSNFTKQLPPYHTIQDDVPAPLQWRGGKDHRPPIGPWPGWGHRGDVRETADWALSPIMGAGDGSPALTATNLAPWGWHSDPAPPNYPPIPSGAHLGCTTGTLP